jgi:hypothetical protein
MCARSTPAAKPARTGRAGSSAEPGTAVEIDPVMKIAPSSLTLLALACVAVPDPSLAQETALRAKPAHPPVARSVIAATPPDATDLLFVTDVTDSLEPAIDAFEAVLGAEEAQAFLDGAPLPALAMQMLAGKPAEEHGLSPKAGLGLFRLPGFSGAVGLVAVTHGERALAAVERQLEELGGVAQRAPAGSTRVVMPDGRGFALFLDRGYLYMALPDPVEPLAGPEAPGLALDELVRRVRAAPPAGLAGSGIFRQLRARVGRGDIQLFLGPGVLPGTGGALVSFALEPERIQIDGFVHGGQLLMGPPTATQGGLLSRAPSGPLLAARLSMAPDALIAFLLGEGGEEVRELFEARGRQLGLSAERILSAFGGEISMLLYVEPTRLLGALMEGSGERGFPGTMIFECSVKEPAVAKAYAAAWMSSAGYRFTRQDKSGVTRLRTVASGQRVEVEIRQDRLRVTTGTPQRVRPQVDIAQEVRTWAGPKVFAPGHTTIALDLAPLQSDLHRPLELEGFDSQELESMQGHASLLLRQLTRVEQVVLDVGPEEGGARVSGRIVFQHHEVTQR